MGAGAPARRGAMLIAIGDVHGHLDHLDALLDLLRPEILRARTAGPELRAGHARRLCRPRPGQPRHPAPPDRPRALLGVPVHVLCGNHDQYLIDFLLAEQPDAARRWRPGATMAAAPRLSELGIRRAEIVNRDPAELAARGARRAGPEVIGLAAPARAVPGRLGGYVCVHAGVDPDCRSPRTAGASCSGCASRSSPAGAGAIRSPPSTATPSAGPRCCAHRIAIDSGTYRTGVLSAVQIEPATGCASSASPASPKLKAFKRLPGLEQNAHASATPATAVGAFGAGSLCARASSDRSQSIASGRLPRGGGNSRSIAARSSRGERQGRGPRRWPRHARAGRPSGSPPRRAAPAPRPAPPGTGCSHGAARSPSSAPLVGSRPCSIGL